ncbi:Na+/H+ antiporter NhaC family protein [bacterium]|nr:MAG: Na+/H+ antiporter NhaC family protein [bacterium]
MQKTHRYILALIIVGIVVVFSNSLSAQDSATVVMSEVEQIVGKSSDATWVSVLPPIIAIVLALVTRQVLFSLFVAIWIGAWLVADNGMIGLGAGFFTTITDYIVPGIATVDHVSIMLFSVLIGGMIGIISENGGARGVIDVVSKYVKTQRQGMVMTSLVGLLIFFDDYANTMVVGNTMRPLTDKLKITRAKLAYLVDSTSAPVATVAIVSTWIGAMLGYISDAESKMPDYHETAYSVFLGSLEYNFYAFLTIFFVFTISASGKDFGPMLKSRIQLLKAKNDPTLDKYGVWSEDGNKEDGLVHSSYLNALIPIFVLVFTTIVGLYITGTGDSLRDIIASSNSYAALLWGSLMSLTVALSMTFFQKLMDVDSMIKAMMSGMHTMFDGLIILVMAWALSELTSQLHTADYLVSVFSESLNPYWLPVVIFILSGLTSFSTGSSWGTMGILMPLVVPLTWALGKANGLDYAVTHELIYASVASVLAGSVWGDHCSPISDTTILSSISSQCDHIEHVRTQLPYSMLVGVVSIFSLILVTVFDLPTWVIYVSFIPILYFFIQKFGDRASELNLDEYKFENLQKYEAKDSDPHLK